MILPVIEDFYYSIKKFNVRENAWVDVEHQKPYDLFDLIVIADQLSYEHRHIVIETNDWQASLIVFRGTLKVADGSFPTRHLREWKDGKKVLGARVRLTRRGNLLSAYLECDRTGGVLVDSPIRHTQPNMRVDWGYDSPYDVPEYVKRVVEKAYDPYIVIKHEIERMSRNATE